ncbi:DinB family protein [Saccharospirillum alexandrii]|uniref:DinB family protein n=1 Tax=Saccharospirillum alexandrii TaxID=2448477 RepID=UPI000FD97990|nr:DinB family protein [Saccharospirillum alexandrii]
MREIEVLTRYKAWADDVFLSALSSLPDTELTTARPIVFGSLLRTLNHSYQMDRVWKCHLLGRPHGLTTRNPDDCPELEELVVRQRCIDEWYVNYADTIAEKELKEIVEFEYIGGEAGKMNRRDILLHVVNHTTYHRGHAAGILYQIDVSPPTTDFPVFLRETTAGI